jgi:8-oxo-dGTP pyrophosphatase MutT (NUDIX family)
MNTILLALHRALLRLLYLGDRVRNRLFKPVTLGARVILVRDGQVLLVRHSYMPGWYLPGGGVKRHESFAEAALRESLEEVGAAVHAMTLHGIYLNVSEDKVDHVAIFAVTDFDWQPVVTAEIAEMRWYPLDALPPGTARGTAARMDEYRDGGAPFHGRW